MISYLFSLLILNSCLAFTGSAGLEQRRHLRKPQSSSPSYSASLPLLADDGCITHFHTRNQRRPTALQANLLTSILDKLLAPSSSKRKKSTETHEVVIIGAGVAGLVTAKELVAQGKDVIVVDAATQVGGRVQTDEYKGFLLDRGFQVFIEAYPAVKRQLNYKALDLQSFLPGALVRAEGGFHTVADPFRRPQDLIKGLLAPIGSLADKVKVGLLRVQATTTPLRSVFVSKETDTLTHLTKTKGLSSEIVNRFFKPFYQGIYLAPLSQQSSRMFEFVFKMFSEGGISLPARGIRAVPEQLAASLPAGSVQLGVSAVCVGDGRVELSDGRVIAADAVVVATEEGAARKLIGQQLAQQRSTPLGGRGSTCLYYSFKGPAPIKEPLLILNGESAGLEAGDAASNSRSSSSSSNKSKVTTARKVVVGTKNSAITTASLPHKRPSSTSSLRPFTLSTQSSPPKIPVNNVVFLSSIAPSYAPPGQTLVSVTVVGIPKLPNAALDKTVRQQLGPWFGAASVEKEWELLRVYRIPYAQPKQIPPTGSSFVQPAEVSVKKDGKEGVKEGLFVAGDYRNTATLNGAFESGERAATAVLAHLKALGPGEKVFKGGSTSDGLDSSKTSSRINGSSSDSGGLSLPPSSSVVPSSTTPSPVGDPSVSSRQSPSSFRRPSSTPAREAVTAFSRFRQENERGRATIKRVVGSMRDQRGSPTVKRFREEERARRTPAMAEAAAERATAAAAQVMTPRQSSSSTLLNSVNVSSRFRRERIENGRER